MRVQPIAVVTATPEMTTTKMDVIVNVMVGGKAQLVTRKRSALTIPYATTVPCLETMWMAVCAHVKKVGLVSFVTSRHLVMPTSTAVVMAPQLIRIHTMDVTACVIKNGLVLHAEKKNRARITNSTAIIMATCTVTGLMDVLAHVRVVGVGITA